MDGIKKLRTEPTRALQKIIAHCRPYFDRGASEALQAVDRQRYYAALFILAERGHLQAGDGSEPDRARQREVRPRVPHGPGSRAMHRRARKAA